MPSSTIEKSRSITLLCRARKALEEARSIDDIKCIRDQAEAVRQYAKTAQLGLDIQNDAAAIKIEAERKAGAILAKMNKNGGRILRGRTLEPRDDTPTLKDIGIGKTQSHRWQLQAAVPEKQFREYLTAKQKSQQEVTSNGLLKLAKQLAAAKTQSSEAPKREGVVHNLESLRGEFSCVYADPPWPYKNQATRASTSNHYPPLSVEEICALPIRDLAAKNAHLHLWTTNAFLFESQMVMEAWGFTFKSCMLWVKPTIGPGNYWRLAHEFLLFGLRGKLPFRDRSQRSWIEAKRLEHSRKPHAFRSAIEAVSPGPYLELFARRPVSGWTVWGNQIENTLFD